MDGINRRKVKLMCIIISIKKDKNIEMPEGDKRILQMFERNKDGLPDDFMQLFKSMFYDVSKKAAYNKNRYFKSEYIYLFFSALVEAATVVIFRFLAVNNNNYSLFSKLVFMSGTIFACIVLVKSMIASIKKTKKYGETWVRHTIHRNELIYEMVRYMENIDCYESVSKETKRSLFKSAIISIEARNDERFAENMKKIE